MLDRKPAWLALRGAWVALHASAPRALPSPALPHVASAPPPRARGLYALLPHARPARQDVAPLPVALSSLLPLLQCGGDCRIRPARAPAARLRHALSRAAGPLRPP